MPGDSPDRGAPAADWLRSKIRDIPDFPSEGIVFKDITPLLADPEAFAASINGILEAFEGEKVDRVLGVEARGFIVAAPIAHRFGASFIPVRKAGKLPWKIERQEYELEYGTDLLEIHKDAISPGDRVLIVDDVLATGGTASATVRLAERLGGTVIGLGFLIELAFLGGREKLAGHRITSLVTFD